MHRGSESCSAPLAAIDVGTNTLRLLIGCFSRGRLQRIAAERAVTRLGRQLMATGLLDREGALHSIATLLEFKAICKKKGVRRISALGTSALREARDSGAFVNEVRERTGISIEIISGEREAELTLKGIVNDYASTAGPAVVLDIGGGSTEWILYGEGSARESIPIGALKLHEQFITSDPPIAEDVERLKNYIDKFVIDSFLKYSRQKKSPLDPVSKRLIATGGTATTVAAIDMALGVYDGERVHLHTLFRPSVEAILRRLVLLPAKERAGTPGLEPERAEIIIPGLLILLAFMDALRIDSLVVSDHGLLEGALMELVENS